MSWLHVGWKTDIVGYIHSGVLVCGHILAAKLWLPQHLITDLETGYNWDDIIFF